MKKLTRRGIGILVAINILPIIFAATNNVGGGLSGYLYGFLWDVILFALGLFMYYTVDLIFNE